MAYWGWLALACAGRKLVSGTNGPSRPGEPRASSPLPAESRTDDSPFPAASDPDGGMGRGWGGGAGGAVLIDLVLLSSGPESLLRVPFLCSKLLSIENRDR